MVEVQAEMAGSVWKVEVKENDAVKQGDILMILESMKMEIPIEAPGDGIVKAIEKGEGDFVQEGDVLIKLETN